MERIIPWTGSDILSVLVPLICVSAVWPHAAAQGLPMDSRQKIEMAASKQKDAVAAMEPSIDRQSDAIRHQLKSSPTTGFFTLPPPQPLSPPLAFEPEASDALPSTETGSPVTASSRSESAEPEPIGGAIRQELMHPVPQKAADLEVRDPFAQRDNVAADTKLLRQLLQPYDGGLALTLGAYNAAPNRVDAEKAIPAGIPGTTNYLQRILSLLPTAQMRSLSFDSDTEH